MGETVTVVRPGTTTDSRANEIPDWSDPARVDVHSCAVAPGPSTEENLERRSVTETPTVFAPITADVESTDRIELRGKTYEVVGNPGDWRNPMTGNRPGLVIDLKRVTG